MTTRDLISPSATGSSDWLNRARSTSNATTADLEEEVRQSRLDRQNRRRRLSGQGVRGFPSSILGEQGNISPQHTGAEISSPVEKEATLRRLMSTKSQQGQSGIADDAPSSRASALLSRYGGQSGPTGTANAGSGESPVSLASFMGGRASGPRLGKLAGDGRSAPPEASLIDDSRSRRGVALPGLAAGENASSPGKGRSLASFLEARAGGRQQSDDPVSPGPLGQQSFAPRSPSPVRRTASPTRSGKVVDSFKPPASPIKRSPSPVMETGKTPSRQSPTKLQLSSTDSASPSKSNINTLAVSPMKNAATSPIKREDINSSSFKSITPTSAATPSWRAPTSVPAAASPAASFPQAQPSALMSPAYASTLASEKGPTPSLTRLKGKGMVGQRLKEAKEREEAAAAQFASTGSSSPSKIAFNRTESEEQSSISSHAVPAAPTAAPRWTVDTTFPPATKEAAAPRSTKWTPHRSGTALPGLSRPEPSTFSSARSASPTRGSSTIQSSSQPLDDRYDVAPVRLPGLGNVKSPFGASAGRASPVKEKAEFLGNEAKEDQPLEHLTKGRARGPARRAARGGSSEATPNQEVAQPAAPEQTKVIAVDTNASAATVQPPPAPLRSTSGQRIVVLISGSGSNLQALIDATVANGPLSHAQITYVISNRKAAFGLQRAATSNPPIPTKVLALKTWQNRNNGGTREQYDEVLAKAVLDAESSQMAAYDESKPSSLPPPDLVVLAGFMHIVSPQFLRALGHRTDLPEAEAPAWRPSAPVPIINLHPALPGAFDGANAIPRALQAFKEGKIKNTGIMVHEVIAEVDRGAPIVTKEIPIFDEDSLEDLETRIHAAEHKLIVEGTRIMLGRAAEAKTTRRERSEAPRAQASPYVELKLSEPVTSLPMLSALQKSILDNALAKPAVTDTVSVETLSIQPDGTTSTLRSEESHILYETESLAVIHRFRSSRSSQMVSTDVYARIGQQASSSASISHKLAELERRFGTKIIDARQGREDLALAQALGGKLETRQGSRKAWDRDDSLMWKFSEGENGVLFIDQVDLKTSNLCSAYCYLISIIGNVFLWKGKGSTSLAHDSAVAHAKAVFGSSARVKGQCEGAEEKSFWTFLDRSQGYASAWHHRHRSIPSLDLHVSPRLFHISTDATIQEHRGGFTSDDLSPAGIALLLLPTEVFLLVGKDARSNRKEIALGLSCAEHLGRTVATRRLTVPSSLPVHIIVYPSVEPKDLIASLRYWRGSNNADGGGDQEGRVEGGRRPFNVLSLSTAKKELLNAHGRWKREVLVDREYLPLGIGVDDL